jgi:DNA repair protein RadD
MAEAFCGEGVRAAHLDGTFSDKERTRLVDAFRAGDIRILCNVELFCEGFDVPGIAYVGLARPTKSVALHMQQCGRGLRPGDDKCAIIADHAGNAFRHGLPDDPRRWSLKGREARQRLSAANDALPVRQCKTCFRVSPSTVDVCPGCGEEFPVIVRQLAQEDGELTKVERLKVQEERRVQRRIEERQCKTPQDFRELGERRAYADPAGWARVRWKLRHGGKIR